MKHIVLFRNDLRLADNPALAAAHEAGEVIPVYIHESTGRPIGGAAGWWLHHSLSRLAEALGGLVLLQGDPCDLIPELLHQSGADSVFWNRRYDPDGVRTDTALKAQLNQMGCRAQSFAGNLLFEPWEVRTGSGDPFRVFSAFWRACRRLPVAAEQATLNPRIHLPDLPDQSGPVALRLAKWGLLPSSPDWAAGFADCWTPGEAGAHARLDAFVDQGLAGYAKGRDRPDQPHVSRMSPHLRFGEISVRSVWHRIAHLSAIESWLQADCEKFLAELGWREFSAQLLYHNPDLATRNLNPKFDAYPWTEDNAGLAAWQSGQTGYPLVDAGMRELWATGYMHNRVRMVAASFLTKHLRWHWRKGEEWFWDTLVDADHANNAASWQWVAGCGADAAPYFRIFNPVAQGRKFDPDGTYIRRWCPELATLPTRYIHAPWEAPEDVQHKAGYVAGQSYPHPIVDHARARSDALAGYASVKAATSNG